MSERQAAPQCLGCGRFLARRVSHRPLGFLAPLSPKNLPCDYLCTNQSCEYGAKDPSWP